MAIRYGERKISDMIDAARLRADLSALAQDHEGNQTAQRAAVLARLKEALANGRAVAERWLNGDGKGTACAQRLSHLEDEIVRVIHDFAATHVYRSRNPSDAERIAIVAVGGYGRGALAPGSDIDLLFLHPYKQTAWGESIVEYLLYMLWDLGQKVGHATRSIDDCIRLARSDQTIRTAVLEARFIWGDDKLFETLVSAYDRQVVKGTGAEFIATKLAERDERHARMGSSRYRVEPNIKEGKGGQRDLHTLFWIAKYFYRVRERAELVELGVFTQREYRRFQQCEDFLWAVRCHLHFLTGRAEERLGFEYQRELAQRLGYTEHAGLRDVERFMKHYFLVAKDIGDLTRILCAALENQHVKKAPKLSGLVRPFRRRKLKDGADFRIVGGRLSTASETVFTTDPVNLIRLYWLAAKHDLTLHPDAIKLATRSLKAIDAQVRKDREANRLLLDILTAKDDPEPILRRMNESGVLGRFVPDFGKIVAMMQFNMYHHYTVDEHLIRAMGELSRIERGMLAKEHPLSHDIIHKVQDRRALYVAMFLHDIAKGRGEDHSLAGAKVARRLGPRLGLSAAETETVAWLIEHHLLMSTIAQSRDLNDRKTIEDFARIVQSPERLKMLLILTVADIKAVGPGVWNGWKGQLLRTLYFETEPVLAGQPAASTGERAAQAQQALLAMLNDWPKADAKAYVARHYPAYLLNVAAERQLVHAQMIRQAERDKLSFATRAASDAFRAITELTVYALDHPRLLAIIAGACAAAGANIADAHIFTTRDGMALDTIYINREFDDEHDELRRGDRIAQALAAALRGEIRLPDIIAKRIKPKIKLKAFRVEPRVYISNGWSNTHTAIEINGLDRPGLLHDLCAALSKLNLNIVSAHISTFGERAVDVFYVTDLTGQKIVSTPRQTTIRKRLLAALEGETKTKAERAR